MNRNTVNIGVYPADKERLKDHGKAGDSLAVAFRKALDKAEGKECR
jgi:hypothetical protein